MKHSALTRRLVSLGALCALTLTFSLPASAFLFWGREETSAGEATVTAFAKNGLPGESISFSADDFRVDADGDVTLDAVVISSSPTPQPACSHWPVSR